MPPVPEAKLPTNGDETMELKQLEYFMAVCRYGSLGKAAGKLYTTQPNVSKVIHQLEAEHKESK